MPTYEYECDHCGHSFELFQMMSESAKRKCPERGRLKLRRLFGSGAAIVFKGSGFYQTDYRSESYKKAAKAEKEKAKGSSGDSAKSAGSSKSESSKSESSAKSDA